MRTSLFLRLFRSSSPQLPAAGGGACAGLDLYGGDDALERELCSRARLADELGRVGLEQAENDLVLGNEERA